MVINFSLAVTVLNIVVLLLRNYLAAKVLKESLLGYLMTKITANSRWVPYIHDMMNREQAKDQQDQQTNCAYNIHYGHIAIEVPFVSHAVGVYEKVDFQFTD